MSVDRRFVGPALGNLVDGGSVVRGPLGKLAETKVSQTKTERQDGPAAGGSLTFATLTGAGTVENLWYVTDCNATYNPGLRLQVFIDGESTPSIDAELATLSWAGADQADKGTPGGYSVSTEHVHGEAQGAGYISGYILFPIPYSDGCVVKMYNPSGASLSGGIVFSQITYSTRSLPYRLKSVCLPWASNTTISSDPYTFLHLSGTAGWVVWHGFASSTSSTAPYHLERNIDTFVDGETTASIATSGTEDYFRSANYFRENFYDGHLESSSPGAAWSVSDTAKNVACAVDLLALFGGVKFTTGVRVEWESEYVTWISRFADPARVGYLVLWYEPYTSGATSAPSPPTNATATPGDAAAAVSWHPPARRGSSALTGHTIRAYRDSDNALISTVSAEAGATSGDATGLTNGTAYYFTVTASNAVGASAESRRTAAVVAGAPDTYDPTAVSGLQLWLDSADAATLWTDTGGTTHATTADAAVARWDDKSGNSRNAIQSTSGNRPLLKLSAQNSKNILYFDGTDDSMLTGLNPSSAMASGFTILSVAKLDDVSGRGYSWIYGDGTGSGGDDRVIFLGKKGSADQLHFGAAGWHLGVDAGTGAFIGAYHQFGHQESQSVRRVLLDGTALTDTTNSTTASVTAPDFYIGRRQLFTELWRGPIAEILVWNRVLTPTERQAAEAYLQSKWSTP